MACKTLANTREYFFNWNGDAGDENDIRLIELVDRIFRTLKKGPIESIKVVQGWSRAAPEGCKSRLGTFTREQSWERTSCWLPTLFYYLLFRRIISETIGHHGKTASAVYVAYLRSASITLTQTLNENTIVSLILYLTLRIKRIKI